MTATKQPKTPEARVDGPEPTPDPGTLNAANTVRLDRLISAADVLSPTDIAKVKALEAGYQSHLARVSAHGHGAPAAKRKEAQRLYQKNPSPENFKALEEDVVSRQEAERINNALRRAAKEGLKSFFAADVLPAVTPLVIKTAQAAKALVAKQETVERTFCELLGLEFNPSPALAALAETVKRLDERTAELKAGAPGARSPLALLQGLVHLEQAKTP